MSEYLGSAFASFVGNRQAPHIHHSRPTPLSLPPAPKALPPPPIVPPLPPSPQPPPAKRHRPNHLPTVLIPDRLAPPALISPVSILSAPTFPHVYPTPTSTPQLYPVLPGLPPTPAPNTPPPVSFKRTREPDSPCLQTFHPVPDPASPAQTIRPAQSHEPVPPASVMHTVYPSALSIPSRRMQSQPAIAESVPPVCRHCPNRQTFPSQDALHAHVRRTHLRPFGCRVVGCTASFSKQNHLSRHVRIVHNKERPFACLEPGCGSRFGSKSHLGDHTRAVHMRLRNFKCGICNASWSKRFNLEKHIRIRHLGEKPFKCRTCQLCFGTRSHVTRHELKVHKTGQEQAKVVAGSG